MSKQNFTTGQVVYSKGYPTLADGTLLTIAPSHKGDKLVSCLDGRRQYHFIDESLLSKDKVPYKASIPTWLSPISVDQLTDSRMAHVYGSSELPDSTIVYLSVTNSQSFVGNVGCRCILK